ncbi:kinase-like domain-containing protein [Mycena olivaceomarginata]|nr:kinase-like domain-containing protein [Mycena olivaceomarginata]
MADIVGSIWQLVDTIVKARDYIHDFRNARKDQKRLLLEIHYLQPLLIFEQPTKTFKNIWTQKFKGLLVFQGTLESLRTCTKRFTGKFFNAATECSCFHETNNQGCTCHSEEYARRPGRHDAVVERINQQSHDDRKLAWLTLSWITNTERPLRPSELEGALSVQPGDRKIDTESLLDVQTTASARAGLVVLNEKDDTIRLMHYTIQNYLERIQSRQFPEAQLQITMTCFTYLSLDFAAQSSWESPFMTYALEHSFNLDERCCHLIETVSRNLHVRLNRDPLIVAHLLRAPIGAFNSFLALHEKDAQVLLDLLQTLLGHDSFLRARPSLFKTLMRLCRIYGLHPTCFALTGVKRIGEHPMAAGGVADIYKGLSRGQCVSIKVSRPSNNNIPAVIKQLGHGSLIWRQLPCHPNLPPSPGPSHFHRELGIVSPWMENGNIEEYLDKKPSDTPPFPGRTDIWMTDLKLVLKILDVALGLEFRHASSVVHGDFQPHNILITRSGRACIAYFGVSSMDAFGFRSRYAEGAARYRAPELVLAREVVNSWSGVYTFSCVYYQILTGKEPFFELRNEIDALWETPKKPSFELPEDTHAKLELSMINTGRSKPTWPASCPRPVLDNLWDLFQECWTQNPRERPTAEQIVQRLVGPGIQATTNQSITDWDDTLTAKFRRLLQVEPLVPSIAQLAHTLLGEDQREYAMLDLH